MIVANKLIKINNGQKEYILQNHICNKYLKYINNAQFYESDNQYIIARQRRTIYKCYIKLDTPIENPEEAMYTDFDFSLIYSADDKTGSLNSCTITYIVDSSMNVEDTSGNEKVLNDYANRTITGIGFTNVYGEVLAYLDTTLYGIKIIKDEALNITRVDEFQTNMPCIGYNYPLHLIPYIPRYVVTSNSSIMYYVSARLYSVGFGTTKNRMNYEYILDNDEIDITKTDTEYSFNLKTGDKTDIYPSILLQPNSRKYPLKRYIKKELYPLIRIHPSTRKYPIESNYKYIIFKYQICEQKSDESTITKLNEFYTTSLYNNYIGLFQVKTKTERRI